ncbi:phytoene dehydrogenase [Calocera cornea HHB12733]|uniref:Phytoene desaturase n=1 Tax=Calocera cornea HHB12733 TaxID=1353952 RepID=A0A165EN30_9BASI|nr:phytoene dehydrogenase [Calocera cornea HHB12733]
MAGFEVTVLEKNEYTGGRCSLLYDGEHRFDRGPSLLLLPHLFHTTFADLGTSLEAEGVTLLKCEPNYVVHFADGERVELSTDLARMKEEIEKWEGKDGFERYLGFMAEAHRHYELSVKHVLNMNFTSLVSILRPSFLKTVFQMHPFYSIYSRACKYFATERLRRLFTFASMYMGMSPFEAPGTYSLLQYSELAEGIWYPIGGFHKIVEALVKVAERNGAKFRLSTPVTRVILSGDGSRAVGAVTASGEELRADVVVINADLVWAYQNLLPSTPFTTALATRKASCSSISFYWSLDRKVDALQSHNVFLAEDFKESFDEIFKDNNLPKDPSFYIHVPSRLDETAAPAGKDTVVVLVPTGHIIERKTSESPIGLAKGLLEISSGEWSAGEEQDFDEMVVRARAEVIKRLKVLDPSMDEFESWISNEQINTPITWREMFNLDRGAILGIAHDFFNVLSFRPKTKHSSIKGCYFVGASTHPGTGVPIVLAGAKLTATQILQDMRLAVPWAPAITSKSKVVKNDLDVPQRLRGAWYVGDILQLLFVLLVGLAIVQYFGGEGWMYEASRWAQGRYVNVMEGVENGTAYFDRTLTAFFTSRTLKQAIY